MSARTGVRAKDWDARAGAEGGGDRELYLCFTDDLSDVKSQQVNGICAFPRMIRSVVGKLSAPLPLPLLLLHFTRTRRPLTHFSGCPEMSTTSLISAPSWLPGLQLAAGPHPSSCSRFKDDRGCGLPRETCRTSVMSTNEKLPSSGPTKISMSWRFFRCGQHGSKS